MPAARRRTPTLSAAAFLCLTLLAMALAGACERDAETRDDESTAVSPDDRTQSVRTGQANGDGEGDGADEKSRDEPDTHGEEHGGEHDDHGGFHLADVMVELGRRYSAIWFAGQVGNQQMVDYQIHEIEEMYDEVAEASPTENGVDVASRLKSDIIAPLEELPEAVDTSDLSTFESKYTDIMDNCESCHADTGHDFINLKEPEYNPYPNLDMVPRD